MNISKNILKQCVIGFVLTFTACSSSDEPGNNDYNLFVPISLDEGSRAVASALPDFSIRLFFNVLKCSKNENTVMSPLSAFMTLSMVANGVDAEARAEIAEALGCSISSLDDINRLCAKYMECLPVIDNRCTVDLANTVWFNSSADVSASYLDAYRPVLSDYFNADIRQASFYDPATLTEINNWCSESTHGKIDKILSILKEDAIGVWLNTLYFKGKWTNPFDPKNTAPGIFTGENGEKMTVDMMSGSTYAFHVGNENFDAISIPYGNTAFQMVLVVPEKGKKLSDIENEITGSVLHNFSVLMINSFVTGDKTGLREYDLSLKMPKFHAEDHIDLIDPLKLTGVNRIFDKDVFSAVSGVDSSILIFDQKVVTETDEDGTKIVAATVATDEPSAIKLDKKEFVVDRPFYYFVMDFSTGAILIAGRMMRP